MWMLEGCAALVHSGVVVLIITPQRPSKKDFCSIYLIDPGVSPHNSVCFYRYLPPPFPDPSVSQLSIISVCIIVAITCQRKKKKYNFLYLLVQRENTICCKVWRSVQPGGNWSSEQGGCLHVKGQHPELSALNSAQAKLNWQLPNPC